MKMFIYGIIFLLFHTLLISQIPNQISYQGRILDTDGIPVADGEYLMVFGIWKDATSTNVTDLVFSETQNVNLVNGFFNVNIGSTSDLSDVNWNANLWLETKVGDNAPYPRTQLTSVPYSFFTYKAETAVKADIATTVEDGAITQSKLADGVMAIPMGTAGGSLEGEYPNPTISNEAIISAIEPGSITQEKLASNITAIPIGEARGDLVGYFPEPTIRPGAIKTEYFAPEVVTEGVIAPDAVTTSRIMDDAVTLEKMAHAATNGQIIWWDTTENTWRYSGGEVAVEPLDDWVLKWNDGGWVEWDKDGLYLPYSYSGPTVDDQTLFSITKTDLVGSVIAAIVSPDGTITSEATAIEATATLGHAINAYNSSSSFSTIYTMNEGGGYALETSGDTYIGGSLTVEGTTAFEGNFDVDGLSTLSDAIIGGNLTVQGDIYMYGILEVESPVYLYSTLEVDGAATFNDDVTIWGTTTHEGDLDVYGTTWLEDLEVYGYTYLYGTLQLPNGATIDEFSIDGTLGDNSDVAVPTEQAVKTYVDAGLAAMSIDGLTDGISDGSSVFLGSNSGINDDGANQNTAVGISALQSNTSGSENTAVGRSALSANTTGFQNTAIGLVALAANTTGAENTAIGKAAMVSNTSGVDNTVIGAGALYLNSGGNSNAVLGHYAGYKTVGSSNVFLGKQAGFNTLGSNNVFIGYQAGQNETGSNKLYIDNSNVSTPLIYGDFATDALTINGTLTTTGLATLPTVNIDGGAIDGTPIGVTTASTGKFSSLQLPTGSTIDEFSTDGTLADNSDVAVPTEQAVKTYVDGAISGSTVFSTTANVTSNAPGTIATDDFVFGSSQLDDDGMSTDDDSRFFFDKSTGAFRAGWVDATEWDVANRGMTSAAFGWNNTASGQYTAAFGSQNTASGNNSAVFGMNATASGHYSMAWGYNATASGNYSTAFGNSTNASGAYSITSGQWTTAEAFAQTTIGQFNTAEAGTPNSWVTTERLFVIGNGTAPGSRSDALVMLKNGNTTMNGTLTVNNSLTLTTGASVNEFSTDGTLADNSDVAVPTEQAVKTYVTNAIGTASAFSTATNVTSNVNGDLANDDFVFGSSSLEDDGNTAHDNRMFFDKSKGAFRAGTVPGTNWNDANRGNYSFAFGRDNKATADYSSAWGELTTASGLYSTAWGNGTTANNENATVWGVATTSSGLGSTAWGVFSTATQQYATAWGYRGQATGMYSTAWGGVSTASGGTATAWGNLTVASGNNATAWGQQSQASGMNATAWGNLTNASGKNSTAIGQKTTAETFNQVTIGAFNTSVAGNATGWTATDRLFVIGNGTGAGLESDALVMLKNGNTTLNGGLTVDNTVNSGLAINVADGGGAVKLSYASLTVLGDAVTIPDNATVVVINSDDNSTTDVIAMPSGTNGQILYVFYSDISDDDNGDFGGIYTTTGSAKLTFVYMNGAWVLMSVIE